MLARWLLFSMYASCLPPRRIWDSFTPLSVSSSDTSGTPSRPTPLIWLRRWSCPPLSSPVLYCPLLSSTVLRPWPCFSLSSISILQFYVFAHVSHSVFNRNSDVFSRQRKCTRRYRSSSPWRFAPSRRRLRGGTDQFPALPCPALPCPA